MKKARLVVLILLGLISVASGAYVWTTPNPYVQVTPTLFDAPALVRQYQQTITSEELAAHLYLFASDFFDGRETGTRGQKLAAHYLASQHRKLGLLPKGTAPTDNPQAPAVYFQPFKVYKSLPQVARLDVVVGGETITTSTFSADVHDDLAYFAFGKPASASGGVLFAGYGIADDELGYNDYAALAEKGLALDGKWLMMLRDEPLADASTSRLPTTDHQPSPWTKIANKKRAVWEAGTPVGVLIVNDVGPRVQESFAASAAEAARRLDIARRTVGRRLSLQAPPRLDLPPVYMISTKLANQILTGSGRTIEQLLQDIHDDLTPVVFEVEDVMVKTTVEPPQQLETENVLAFIEGIDPVLKEEVVVLTSHYDHLGNNPRGRSAPEGDQLFNGAADDGSGTVAALEIAEAFMRAKQDGHGPRRSILFLHTSAEEKGLLGSAYYTDWEPVVPLDRIVANLNMDGIGGFDSNHPTGSKNYIYLVGSPFLSQEIRAINERANALMRTPLELTLAYDKAWGSDHQNFEKHLIPFLYYSTGLTEHYHRVSDEPATIDYEHMTRVARLVFATAWQIVNQDTAPASIGKDRLVVTGYVCPPCPVGCDHLVFEHPGRCPVCGMILKPLVQEK